MQGSRQAANRLKVCGVVVQCRCDCGMAKSLVSTTRFAAGYCRVSRVIADHQSLCTGGKWSCPLCVVSVVLGKFFVMRQGSLSVNASTSNGCNTLQLGAMYWYVSDRCC
jgi:hypothetical protein